MSAASACNALMRGIETLCVACVTATHHAGILQRQEAFRHDT